jgi:tetratricopeptide (TPR) repeat protein
VGAAPAEWILYPMAPATVRPKGEFETVFTRSFSLERAPEQAQLTLRMYREGRVTINGAPVPFAASDGAGWKSPREGDVGSLLRTGENQIEVRVRTRFGPPALWLALELDGLRLASDEGWTASLMGAEEAAARLASVPLDRWPRTAPSPERLDAENPRPLDALRSHAREIGSLFLLGGLLALGISFALRRQALTRIPAGLLACAWLLVACVWLALFVNNGGLEWGFDAKEHRIYINAILQEGRLPLADEGWQTYQPPLYYLLAAGWLKLAGFARIDSSAVSFLRWLGCAAGMLQALFVLLALRELMPRRPGLVLCAFVFGMSLPVHLYLFQMVTNEAWVAMLSSGALWWTIRMLKRAECSVRDHAILGLFLGLAMLAKFSALIPLVLCPSVLLAQQWLRGGRRLGPQLARIGTTLAVVLAVCGWHYLRVAMHFGGNPFVGNWDEASGQAWWQDPGYHVIGDYLRFGLALERPLLSAVASVPDALYSTLWGDGMLSGISSTMSPPPWNLDWMAAGYGVALGPCLALLLGALLGLFDFVRNPRAERFLVLAVLGATFYALLSMTLRLPFYTQAKAFYGLSALVPLAFCFALGFDALALRWRGLRAFGVAWLAGWALLANATFFVSPENSRQSPLQAVEAVDPGGWIGRAREAIGAGRSEQAIVALRRALALNPDQATLGATLAELLRQTGRKDEALAVARAALRVAPAGQGLHMLAGELWLEQGAAQRAAFHFGAAARLLPDTLTGHIEAARKRQVETLREAGLWSEAIDELQRLRARGELERASSRLLAELLLDAPVALRDPALARTIAEEIDAEAKGGDLAALELLAAAQAANGHAAEAAHTQERALAGWRAKGDAGAVERAELRLREYRRAAAG